MQNKTIETPGAKIRENFVKSNRPTVPRCRCCSARRPNCGKNCRKNLTMLRRATGTAGESKEHRPCPPRGRLDRQWCQFVNFHPSVSPFECKNIEASLQGGDGAYIKYMHTLYHYCNVTYQCHLSCLTKLILTKTCRFSIIHDHIF